MLVFSKRSHRCPFCPSRVHQEAKAEVISKSCQNFWTKYFQQNPHNTYVENSTESLMAPSFQRIKKVTDTHTHRMTTVTFAHAPRVKYNSRTSDIIRPQLLMSVQTVCWADKMTSQKQALATTWIEVWLTTPQSSSSLHWRSSNQ